MKKFLFVLTAVFLTAVMPLPVYAEETTAPITEETQPATRAEDLYTYILNAGDEAQITDFPQKETFKGDLNIPAVLDGHAVTKIEDAAFMNAKGITSVTIPATVNDIGSSAFFGCTSLQKFIVQEGSPYLSASEDGVLFADKNQFLVAYPAGKPEESYTIPGTVDEIAPGCFGFAQNLQEVIIPESVKFIDKWAFAYSKIDRINIPSSVTQIDDYAFAYCEELSQVNLNSGLQFIYDASFSCCTALTEITLPETLLTVGQCAFCGTGLKSVTIPNGVSEIDYCAFGYDKDMKVISDFVIYGTAGSTAQSYCTETDDENDYYNQFTFIDVNAEESEEETAEHETRETSVSENSSQEEILQESAADAGMKGLLGAELKNNQFLQVVLATVGGIAVILAITLVILFARKPKNSNQQDDDQS